MKKVLKVLLSLLVLFIVVEVFLFTRDFTPEDGLVYGVTFSTKYAEELELDWREAYLAILDDLNVSHIRLIAYWDQIEVEQDEYTFIDLDWQVEQARQRDIEVVLTVGRRTPRWPECHDPLWLPELSKLAVQQQQLEFVRDVVIHYQENETIKYWQVENEPLFAWFGHCPRPSKDFLEQEVDLVRSLDDRPIIVTDSGELNHWQGAGDLADTLGITMYRVVWNPYFGFSDYFFLPASVYKYRADLTKLFQKNLDAVIVTELQMEPWTMGRPMVELTLEEQQQSFDINRFSENITYVHRAGFSEVYLWGVEYWYWQAKQGNPQIWEKAKTLWQ